MKLSDYVIRWGKDRPDHAFLSLDGKTITYGEADAFTKGKGESLPEEVHGKVVALYLTDPASQVLWFLAVERAGAVPLLVHEYIKGERLEELFDARPIDFFRTARRAAFPFPKGKTGFSLEESRIRASQEKKALLS